MEEGGQLGKWTWVDYSRDLQRRKKHDIDVAKLLFHDPYFVVIFDVRVSS